MKPYTEIYDDIRKKIRNGELTAEAEVRNVYGDIISFRSEYDKAVALLVDDGLLRQESGKILVNKVRARSKRGSSFKEDYSAQGRKTEIKVIKTEVVPVGQCPVYVQDAYKHQKQTSMLFRYYHVQIVDGIPHAVADSYFPFEIVAEGFGSITSGDMDVYDYMKNKKYVPTRKKETLYVDSPDSNERVHLKLSETPGIAVVRLDCSVFSDATLIECCMLCDRADLYEFTYDVRIEG